MFVTTKSFRSPSSEAFRVFIVACTFVMVLRWVYIACSKLTFSELKALNDAIAAFICDNSVLFNDAFFEATSSLKLWLPFAPV